ncbi:MAG: hypothetical protein ABSG41_23540 [Bryobacteraceae bacterium]|jgi:hypothetical protein
MLLAAICLAALLIAIWRDSFAGNAPLDRAEIRVIRHYADQIRKEQIQPFD